MTDANRVAELLKEDKTKLESRDPEVRAEGMRQFMMILVNEGLAETTVKDGELTFRLKPEVAEIVNELAKEEDS